MAVDKAPIRNRGAQPKKEKTKESLRLSGIPPGIGYFYYLGIFGGKAFDMAIRKDSDS